MSHEEGDISMPPDPGAVANSSPDLAPQPAHNYFRTSDTKFFALGRRRGPRGQTCHLKVGTRVRAPRAALRSFQGPPTREQSQMPPPTYFYNPQSITSVPLTRRVSPLVAAEAPKVQNVT